MNSKEIKERAISLHKEAAHDILSKQVGELKDANKELIKRLDEIKRYAEKINEFTFNIYKEQILLTIKNELDFLKKT